VSPLEIVVGVREILMLLINSHILKMAMLEPSAEYNRRAAYHRRSSRWAFSNGNNSVLWIQDQPFMTFGKIYGFRIVQWRFQYARKNRKNASRGPPQLLKRLKSADFEWLRNSIVAKISIACWCKWANNASNCWGRSSIQIVYIKDTTDALWDYQDKLLASVLILVSQQPRFKSLGLLRMERSWKGSQTSLSISIWRH